LGAVNSYGIGSEDFLRLKHDLTTWLLEDRSLRNSCLVRKRPRAEVRAGHRRAVARSRYRPEPDAHSSAKL